MNKRALLIGINKYAKLAPHYQLSGCIHDVKVMANLLRDKFGFPEANISIICDEQATRQGICAAMELLISMTMQDDIIVIHYSGHGSRVTDIHNDDPSGMDSTIVPHDSGRRTSPNRDITDDEIHMWLSRLTQVTRYVTLIFDSCHSGTISRDVFGDTARWVEPDERPASEIAAEMEAPVVTEVVVEEMRAVREKQGIGGSGWLLLGKRYVLIAGCRDNESAYERPVGKGTEMSSQGALTYFLCQELALAGSTTTYRDLFDRVHPLVTSAYPNQHPQIEGQQDIVLFGMEEIPVAPFIRVTAREHDLVRLGGGAALGLTAGSQWAIYPEGVKHADSDSPPLGRVEITNVRAVSSDAMVLDPTHAHHIKPGCRAFETDRSYGAMRMTVDLHPAPASYAEHLTQLASRIADSKLLNIRTPDESVNKADVRIYLILPRSHADTGDPVPQLGAIAVPTWVVVGREGRLIMPPHPINAAHVLNLIIANLEKIARYRNALSLENRKSALVDNIGFKLLRQDVVGVWKEALPDSASGQVVFEHGERVALEIVNLYHAPVYISVLDFGLTSGIFLIFPPNRPSDKFEPHCPPVRLGERYGDRIELYMPNEFKEDSGVEVFKLFATTHEANFSWLAQGGVRSMRKSRSSFETVFETAINGTQDQRQMTVPVDEEWTTVERAFFLRRKTLL